MAKTLTLAIFCFSLTFIQDIEAQNHYDENIKRYNERCHSNPDINMLGMKLCEYNTLKLLERKISFIHRSVKNKIDNKTTQAEFEKSVLEWENEKNKKFNNVSKYEGSSAGLFILNDKNMILLERLEYLKNNF
jgi:hypothetical protein